MNNDEGQEPETAQCRRAASLLLTFSVLLYLATVEREPVVNWLKQREKLC